MKLLGSKYEGAEDGMLIYVIPFIGMVGAIKDERLRFLLLGTTLALACAMFFVFRRMVVRTAKATPGEESHPVLITSQQIANAMGKPLASVIVKSDQSQLLPDYGGTCLKVPSSCLSLSRAELDFAIALALATGRGVISEVSIGSALSATGDRAAAASFFAKLYPSATWRTPWDEYLSSSKPLSASR